MTTDKDFKRLVRERAAKTGERYSAARAQLARSEHPEATPSKSSKPSEPAPAAAESEHSAGFNPETCALRNALARLGLPLSEAMVLGVGGGLGGGYMAITHGMTGFMIGARALWWDTDGFVKQACERLGVPVTFHQTSSASVGEKQALEALAAGTPPLVWLDQSYLPYSNLPSFFHKGGYHVALLYELDPAQDRAVIGDVGKRPFTVSAKELAAARKSITNYKHRTARLALPKGELDLRRPALEGVAACVEGLVTGFNKSCTMDGFKVWGESLLGRKEGKKGDRTWEALFPPGPDLFRALTFLYRFVEQWGGEGLLRPLYAQFLEEAAALTGRKALREAAEHYRRCGELWHQVARAALPDEVAALRERRELLDRSRKALLTQGDAGVGEIQNAVARMESLAAAKMTFPLGASEIRDLFDDLGGKILAAHAAEVAAREVLARVAA
jgi:hypothetical protein